MKSSNRGADQGMGGPSELYEAFEQTAGLTLLDHFPIRLYNGVYGYTFYGGTIMQHVHKTPTHFAQSSLMVRNFKLYEKHGALVKLIMKTMQTHFDCADIVVVPAARPERISHLQKLFGTKLKRIAPVNRRTYGHNALTSTDYMKSLEIDREAVTGNRVLLVDDIYSTGKTMTAARQVVEAACECRCFVLAFAEKLYPHCETAGDVYIYGAI